MTDKELVSVAKTAAEYAYAPYSNFCVGAALVTEEEIVYTGCNIENASYGATICAERTAIFKAVSEGKRKFSRIAVVSKSGATAYPCGMCLQVINEFMPDGEVLVEENGDIVVYPVKDLLPKGFVL